MTKTIRKILLFLLHFIAIMALVVLIWQPKKERAIEASSAILITDAYALDSLESLIDQFKKTPAVFSLDTSINSQKLLNDVIPIKQFNELFVHSPLVRKLHIWGYGLKEADFAALDSLELNFYPLEKVVGFESLGWNQRLLLGEKLQIAGLYRSDSPGQKWLHITGEKGIKDSLLLEGDSITFSRSIPVRSLGRQLLEVAIKEEGETTLDRERIAIQVEEVKEPAVLMLSAQPNSEFKFLKNYLQKEAYQVALRNQVSKDKFASAYVNMEAKNLSVINSSLLQNFDLLLVDQVQVSRFTDQEVKLINRAIQRNGLSLLMIVDDMDKLKQRWLNQFQWQSATAVSANQKILGDDYRSIESLVSPSHRIKANFKTFPLIENANGEIYLASIPKGNGQLAVSLINKSFQWQLKGFKKDYEAYWAYLLESLMYREQADDWEIKQTFPQVDQVLEFSYKGKGENLYLVKETDSTRIGALKSAGELIGQCWPTQSGWQVLSTDNTSHDIYVYERNAWQANAKSNRLKAMSDYMLKREKVLIDIADYEKEPIALWPFFLLFVFSMGGIWWLEKRG